MFKQRHICIILSAVFGLMLSMHTYAYYTAESANIHNQFSISRIVYIDFEAGSGSGDIPSSSLALNADTVLPDNHFTKQGYHFAGWSLSSDGDVLSDAQALIEASGSLTHITLYASWAPNSYTVSFIDNEVSGGTLPSNTACTYDTGTAVPAYTAAADDKLFVGWSTKADGSSDIISPTGSIYNLCEEDNGRVTLYAQWEDESADVPEPNWNKHYNEDKDGNGTPDRLELGSGSTWLKDPSVKNHTSKDCYGYIAVYVPAIRACLKGTRFNYVFDIAKLININSHWTLVDSSMALNAGNKSVYLYRYDTVLKAHGSKDISVNHTLRHADRSTDLMSSFRIQDFESVPSGNYSIDVKPVLVEAIVSESEADALVKSQLGFS